MKLHVHEKPTWSHGLQFHNHHPATVEDVKAYLAEHGLRSLESKMVDHLVRVSEAVLELCEPKHRQSYEDATEHYGGMAMEELEKLIDLIKAAGEGG